VGIHVRLTVLKFCTIIVLFRSQNILDLLRTKSSWKTLADATPPLPCTMRVGLYLHPHGMLAIQSLRLPPMSRGLGSVLPYRSRDVGSTDFDE
jgi:hypothetical protein